MFKKLWGQPLLDNNLNVISDPVILKSLFELTYLNGHNDMANYILNLMYAFKSTHRNQSVSSVIKYTYKVWNTIPDNTNYVYLEYYQESSKFELLLQESISNDNIKFAINLIKDFSKLHKPRYVSIPNYSRSLSYTISIKSFNKLTKWFINNGYWNYYSIANIILNAFKISNFSLAIYLLNDNPQLKTEETLTNIFSSKSPDTLEILKSIKSEYYYNVLNLKLIPYEFNNKEVVYYILDNAINNKDKIKHGLGSGNDNYLENEFNKSIETIILFSYNAFKPYEYVNLIENYIGCLNERKNLQKKLIINGEYYKAKIVHDEVVKCEKY